MLDSNVLIDYLESDRSILTMFSRHVGATYVIAAGLGEVRQIDEAGCKKLGLSIYEERIEELFEAERRPLGRLSKFDLLCFLVARNHAWVCATNDKALWSLCAANRVEYVRGLRLLIDLVVAGHLDGKQAMAIATDISLINPYITPGVIEAFGLELEKGNARRSRTKPPGK